MKRASRKKYHYFYKTTCIITNRYYYGIHSTDNLNDGYIGSGKRLWYSIKKYGIENHNLEILEFFDTRKKLVQKEIDFVNEDLLKDPMCMNLHLGGEGGFVNEEHRQKCSRAALKSMWNNDEYIKNHKEKQRKRFILYNKSHDNSGKNNGMYGKKHSNETKKQISEKMMFLQKGHKNSQYGTHWITDGFQNKKIKEHQPILNGWHLGRTIK